MTGQVVSETGIEGVASVAPDFGPSAGYASLTPESDKLRIADKASGAELIAYAWAIRHGLFAFRSENKNGPVDVIFLNRRTGEIMLVDVKSVAVSWWKKKTTGEIKACVHRPVTRPTPEQQRLGVRLLFVTVEGFCSFDLEEAYRVALADTRREPPGGR